MHSLTLQEEGYTLTSDKTLMDTAGIYNWLSGQSYWAKNIPFDVFLLSFNNAYTAGILADGRQVAYARMITDYATFAYLADVFVVEEFRGRGLSTRLLAFILEQPWISGLRRIMLATLDAHELYARYGFRNISVPERLMERVGLVSYELPATPETFK